jgi:hypothetical protein
MNKIVRIVLALFFWVATANVFSAEVQTDPFAKADQVQKGLFTLYVKGSRYYFEIPRRLMGRDFLLASRVSELSSPENRSNIVAGQRLYDPIVVRFAEEPNKVLLLRPDPEKECAPDDPFFASFVRNHLAPIADFFDVEYRSDSSVFIEVTRFFTDDLPAVEPFNEKSKPGKPLTKLSGILKAESFPGNIEFTVRNAYETTKEPFLVILQKSLILLPEKPAMGRFSDERMSYDVVAKEFYSSQKQEVEKRSYITRFPLYPKEQDQKAYQRGALVEPANSIVFYVDNAFPETWKSAIMKGIEDWQQAFEAIGFKKAIVARPYPTNDPDFNPNDSRYNCFKLAVCTRSNAMGVHWADPRSGEIVQAEVLYYSNITELLHKWYFLQTAAVNPAARKRVLDEKTMQQLIRYSAAHEIGHCLGLTHNFRASFAYDTEQLRDPAFTRKNGTTPSIMDYARFNYVAQPGDQNVSLLPPVLGVYDIFSIKIGYQPVPNAKTAKEEQVTVAKWLLEKDGDPVFTYGKLGSLGGVVQDPSRQSSDLGNDPVASSTYGIRNLRYILAHLKEWMQTPGENYDYITGLYEDIRKENFAYLDNVMPMIAGVFTFNAVSGGKALLYRGVDQDVSLCAARFIVSELYSQAAWLDNDSVRSFAGPQAESLIRSQTEMAVKMLDDNIIKNLYLYGKDKNRLQPEDYIVYLSNAIFAKPASDLYVQNIQKVYLERLKVLSAEQKEGAAPFACLLIPTVKKELNRLKDLFSKSNDEWYLQLKTTI